MQNAAHLISYLASYFKRVKNAQNLSVKNSENQELDILKINHVVSAARKKIFCFFTDDRVSVFSSHTIVSSYLRLVPAGVLRQGVLFLETMIK